MNLTNSTLFGADLFDVGLSGAILAGADLSFATLTRVAFFGTDLSNSKMNGTIFADTDMSPILGHFRSDNSSNRVIKAPVSFMEPPDPKGGFASGRKCYSRRITTR